MYCIGKISENNCYSPLYYSFELIWICSLMGIACLESYQHLWLQCEPTSNIPWPHLDIVIVIGADPASLSIFAIYNCNHSDQISIAQFISVLRIVYIYGKSPWLNQNQKYKQISNRNSDDDVESKSEHRTYERNEMQASRLSFLSAALWSIHCI